MSASLLDTVNRVLPDATPEPWSVHAGDPAAVESCWGERRLATTLVVRVRSDGPLVAQVWVGPFYGASTVWVADEIPTALRRAYVDAFKSAQGTEDEPRLFKDVARAPRWLQDALRHAIEQEVCDSELEATKLRAALDVAQERRAKAVASRALLPEEPKP